MLDEALIRELSGCGIDLRPYEQTWSELARLLAAFEAVARSGVNAIVKLDGARPGPAIYTVVVSGGSLGEHFFRNDGAELKALLREALTFFIEHVGRRSGV